MNRLEMLDAARQRAYEMINDSSCLDDKQFKELQVLPEETAVNRLAIDFLDEALEDNDIEDEEPEEIEEDDEDEDDCLGFDDESLE